MYCDATLCVAIKVGLLVSTHLNIHETCTVSERLSMVESRVQLVRALSPLVAIKDGGQ